MNDFDSSRSISIELSLSQIGLSPFAVINFDQETFIYGGNFSAVADFLASKHLIE